MDVSIVSRVITGHIAQVRAGGLIRGPRGRVIIPVVVTIGIVILLHGCRCFTLGFLRWTASYLPRNQIPRSQLELRWHLSSAASSFCPPRHEATPAVLVPGGVVVPADGAAAANAAGISTFVTPSFTVVFEGWPSMSMFHFRMQQLLDLSFTENYMFITIIDQDYDSVSITWNE